MGTFQKVAFDFWFYKDIPVHNNCYKYSVWGQNLINTLLTHFCSIRLSNYSKGKKIDAEREKLANLNENMRFKGGPKDVRYAQKFRTVLVETEV